MAASPALSDPIRLYGSEVKFDVYRKGTAVGTHTISFEPIPLGHRVNSQFGISIRFLFFQAYNFQYQSEAFWHHGQLDQIAVTVDKNGEVFSFQAVRDGTNMLIEGSDHAITAPAPIYPTNHWNAEVLDQEIVLNTLTGRTNEVKIIQYNEEMVITENGEVPATRYLYTGEIETEVWYDGAGRWVKMRFQAEDGSTIEYLCRQCQGGPSAMPNP